MEAGDSAINAFIAGSFASGLEGTVSKEGIKRVGSVISTILNSGGNSTQTYVREKEAGATDRTAMNRAFIEFALDAAFEYPIMDQVFDGWNQQGIRGALKTGGARSLESLAQNGLRTAIDIVLNGDENRVNALTQAYVRGGLSEREAQSRAIWDTVGEFGAEAVVAFIGGVGETYASNLVQRVEEWTQKLRERGRKIIDSGAVEDLLKFAELAPPGSSAHAAGEVFQEYQLARELRELKLLPDDAIVDWNALNKASIRKIDSLEVALLDKAASQTLQIEVGLQSTGKNDITELNLSPEAKVVAKRYYNRVDLFVPQPSGVEYQGRVSPRQSEIDAAVIYSGYQPQVSFFNGAEVRYGHPNSVRPDLYKTGHSIEVKNRIITDKRRIDALARNVAKQYWTRTKHLPKGTRQGATLDVRGQDYTADMLSAASDAILKKTKNGMSIHTLRWEDKK